MSLYKRNDSPHWWVKISHSGRTIQRSTGTADKSKAQEYHDKLKASLWEQQRLASSRAAHGRKRLFVGSPKRRKRPRTRKTSGSFAGSIGSWALMLDEITLDVIDRVKAEKLKTVNKPTVNRYLALVRAILLRARDEWEWIDKMPKVKLFKEPPGRERSITMEQAETAW